MNKKVEPSARGESSTATIISRESESIEEIDQRDISPIGPADNEKEAFKNVCIDLSKKWDRSATIYELLYYAAMAVSAISSGAIAFFASTSASIYWVKVVAFVGLMAGSASAFLSNTASKRRAAHRIMSNAVVRYVLGKSDTNGLLNAYENANKINDLIWLPAKKDDEKS